jgi:hypothetical protein
MKYVDKYKKIFLGAKSVISRFVLKVGPPIFNLVES